MSPPLRWVSWQRMLADNAPLDAHLARKSGTLLHAVEGHVGGYADEGTA